MPDRQMLAQNGEYGDCDEIVPLIDGGEPVRGTDWDESNDSWTLGENPKLVGYGNADTGSHKTKGHATSRQDSGLASNQWSINDDNSMPSSSPSPYAQSSTRQKHSVARSASSFMGLQDIVENYYSVCVSGVWFVALMT